jgi:transposase-like protein
MKDQTNILNTELVTGHCPECHLDTILVGIQHSFYRCTNCGEDIEQKVNGVIKYMLVDKKTKIRLRDLDDTDGQEER